MGLVSIVAYGQTSADGTVREKFVPIQVTEVAPGLFFYPCHNYMFLFRILSIHYRSARLKIHHQEFVIAKTRGRHEFHH